MNAIMNFITMYVCQIAFVQYFKFWTFVSLNFGCTHSKFCMHTCDKHTHHSTYVISIWIFSKLRSKAYVDRCRACIPQVLSVKRSMVCTLSPQQLTKIVSHLRKW